MNRMKYLAWWREGRVARADMRRSLLLATLTLLIARAASAGATYSIPGFTDTPVATGLSAPTAFTWTPDGRMLILEKAGKCRIVIGGVLQVTAALDITSSVDSGVEKGLLGICLDPGFAGNGFVYLYYTTLVPKNRISRFTMSGNSLSKASEVVILDNIDATNGNHNGGNIAIGPDGKLYAAPGDSGTGGAKSQNLSPGSLNGKVLRMNLNGTAAAGNPFIGDATKEQRILAYGFRNPYRFTFRPSNGSLYVADVGQNTIEELDVVAAGGNYGWPMMEGDIGSCAGCILPVFEYDHSVGQTIIGGTFVNSAIYPAFLHGKYVFGDFSASWIRYLDFTAGDVLSGTLQDFATNAEAPVHFAMGPDGAIYFAAINTGKIYRINPPGESFFTVTPCRAIDTRRAPGPLGGPALGAGSDRDFDLASTCAIPATARSVSVNVTVTQPANSGSLLAYAAGTSAPSTPTIAFGAGQTRANNAVVTLDAAGTMTVHCSMASGSVHLIVDVNGYFQ